jgi:hypothetical protein
MTNRKARYRALAGPILLIVLTGYAVLNLLVQSVGTYQASRSRPRHEHEERIRQPKPFLPASGAVGYVTTVENEAILHLRKELPERGVPGPVRVDAVHPGPLFVRNSPEFPMVVGNFIDGPPPRDWHRGTASSGEGLRRRSHPVPQRGRAMTLPILSLIVA